jgi:hypothetical protein
VNQLVLGILDPGLHEVAVDFLVQLLLQIVYSLLLHFELLKYEPDAVSEHRQFVGQIGRIVVELIARERRLRVSVAEQDQQIRIADAAAIAHLLERI